MCNNSRKISLTMLPIVIGLYHKIKSFILPTVNGAVKFILLIQCQWGRVNVGKSKVMRCSRHGNWDRMHVIQIGEPVEEVDCFKYQGSQMAADGGCESDVVHRMNEGHRGWGALKKCPEQ